jgi:polyhydroxyalkanoate synthesis repressor PhaR
MLKLGIPDMKNYMPKSRMRNKGGSTADSSTAGDGTSAEIELRKYSNRRYYAPSKSRHMTLDEVHELILSGKSVQVTDFKTGEDISHQVLLQILIDHAPLKLQMLPREWFYLLIQANESIVKEFVQAYFFPALQAFLGAQQNLKTCLPFDWNLQDQFTVYSGLVQAMGALTKNMFFPSGGLASPMALLPDARSQESAPAAEGNEIEAESLRQFPKNMPRAKNSG